MILVNTSEQLIALGYSICIIGRGVACNYRVDGVDGGFFINSVVVATDSGILAIVPL